MTDLFPDLAPAPDGFLYREALISEAEAAQLAAWLQGLPFRPFEFRGVAARREVISFGWRYDSHRARLLQADNPPPELLPLRARAAALAGLEPADLAQVLVNRYAPGAPIGWHRDRPIFDRIVGVSLLSPAALRFRRRTATGFERVTRMIAPRSAYVLTGPARDVWEHSIPPAPALRYSITFRNFRPA